MEDSWLQAPLAPLAKGLLSIFSFVTYQTKRKIEKKWLLHPILHPDLLLFCWFNSCLFESSMNRSLLFSASCLWLVKSNKSSSKLHFLRLYDSKETRMKNKNWKLPFRFGRPWLRWIQSLWRHKCGKSSRVASKCRWHVLNENEAGTCASSSIWSAKQKKHQKSLKNAAQKNNKNSQFPSVPKKSLFSSEASNISIFAINLGYLVFIFGAKFQIL